MKNRARSLAALIMALIVGAVTLTGCLEVNGERVAVVIGKEKYTVSEARLYFYYEQYLTEISISSLVSSLFGSYENYWSATYDDYSAVDSCRTEAMKLMVQTKILCMEAEKAGVTLTEEEEALVTDAANEMMREVSSVVDASEATKDEIIAFCRENALANKEYLVLTDGIDTEIDAADIERRRVTGITIMPIAGTDEDGNANPANTDEWKATIEKYSAEIKEKLAATQDVTNIVAEYEENEEVIVSGLGEMNMAMPDDYVEGTIDDYEDLGWSLSTGETEELVMLNASDKYVSFVFYCIDDHDEEYAEEATEDILADRRSELFPTVYEEVLKSYRKIHVYLEAVDFTVSETMFSDSEIVSY